MAGLRMFAPLRVRDFAVFWAGLTVSFLGDGFFYVAIAWQVYDLWNAPSALAIVGVAETVPLVALLLIGGVVTDRVERRWVLFWSAVVRGLCVGLLGALAVSGVLELWQVFAIAGVYGAGQAFWGPASGAIVPDLLPRELLIQANSLAQFIRPLTFRLAGPAVGGWIVHELGAGTAFLADAVTFAFVALMLTLLTARTAPAREPGAASVLGDIRDAVRFARGHVWLWGTLGWAFVALLLTYGPFEVLVPYLVKNELGGDAGDLGLVFAAGGVGAVLASLSMGQLGLPRLHITFMYAVWGFGTLDIALYALAEVPWHAMAVALISEACFAAGLIVWVTLMQRLVPNELLGRVKSLDWLVSIGFVPVSYALTGPMADLFGVKTVMVGAGVGGGILTVAFFLLPGMRDTEREGSAAHVVLRERGDPQPVEG